MAESKNPGGAVLAAWREGVGKTQSECAKDIGVRQSTWSEWEAGAKNPQIKYAIRIARLTEDKVPVACWAPEEAAPPESFSATPANSDPVPGAA